MDDEKRKLVIIDGVSILAYFDLDTFRSALNYQAKQHDTFIVTYPKSGTTRMQIILYTLMNKGKAFDDNMADSFSRVPFLDTLGEDGLKNMHHPYVIKTHLPLRCPLYNENGKYICVLRNPKDVCVSLFYFSQSLLCIPTNQKSFDEFFENFTVGNVMYGSYFDHLKCIWQHRNSANVFLTSFEEMQRNLVQVIRRLADFMDIELNDHLLERILTYSSFNYMKERFDDAYRAQARIALDHIEANNALPMTKEHLELLPNYVIVRQGAAGKWSSIMSGEQAHRLDSILREKIPDIAEVEQLFSM